MVMVNLSEYFRLTRYLFSSDYLEEWKTWLDRSRISWFVERRSPFHYALWRKGKELLGPETKRNKRKEEVPKEILEVKEYEEG